MNHRIYHDKMASLLHDALKKLMDGKHLYQYVEVDLAPLLEISRAIEDERRRAGPTQSSQQPPRVPETVEEILSDWRSVANIHWVTSNIHGSMGDIVQFQLPSINTYCATCKSKPPFNPISEMSCSLIDPGTAQNQWYHLAYQCQQCKGTPVVFLVRRERLKLRLTGRDPLEAVPAPKELPKAQAKYFSNAKIAHNAGQTLAAIFLLRTFIEQFWRSIPEVQAVIKNKPRATGDEQGTAYHSTLPTGFADRFPSLPDIYTRLSEAMHLAKADAVLFETSCVDIEKHFKARQVFEMFAPAEADQDAGSNT